MQADGAVHVYRKQWNISCVCLLCYHLKASQLRCFLVIFSGILHAAITSKQLNITDVGLQVRVRHVPLIEATNRSH